ncbi:MAG: 4-hydroxyphenylpyruvate dioxygenase [Hyphomonadaceae bacterium]|nr:MAG: 4-hydroxyphenylpyruvate dioxygenase [Hyphomonadaceae bacterium]
MADLFDEFVEFTGPNPAEILAKLRSMGFVIAGKHRSKDVLRLKQGDINFILNMETQGQPSEFGQKHGQSANAMAFRVKDAAFALLEAAKRGAEVVENKKGPLELDIPCIRGIGGSYVYLVDRYGDKSIYDIDFEPVSGAAEDEAKHNLGFTWLDHLTHNVYKGEMEKWADFYERVFNFREIRYFDIEGKVSGLTSKAMTSPCGKIRIPINESKGVPGKLDQIAEYLQKYNGEGIQHIALGTNDLYKSVDGLRANGVELQDTIDTYFDLIDKRLPGHGENVEELRKRRILIDGAPSDGQGLLLQIFSTEMLGPIFFEFIQRKGNEGFGEGNFRALFESIELDQIRRGVLAEA